MVNWDPEAKLLYLTKKFSKKDKLYYIQYKIEELFDNCNTRLKLFFGDSAICINHDVLPI
jgi:hypothetical protein